MKILWCQVLRDLGNSNGGDEATQPCILDTNDDLYNTFSMFQRGTVREILQCASRTFAKRTTPSERVSIPLDEIPYTCFVFHRINGMICVAVCDNEYPERVAFAFLSKVGQAIQKFAPDFKKYRTDQNLAVPEFEKLFAQYQDPNQADQIMQINANLEETKKICHKNIEQILERGENLDVLMERSADVSATSMAFYKQAKSANSCCNGIL